eukprot:TRINITY_DN3296_c0_g1_i3.p1 TRINITY_DN3296_c0_g1~~TRINITY_DN3296_c0_g1_i3.p1  ORF type:complete len:1461 (+),score=325.87 TRINITY_DN3296_c0_g1_i3:432-4814(+)
MRDYYGKCPVYSRPKVLGLTGSPVSDPSLVREELQELENNLFSRIFVPVKHKSELDSMVCTPTETIVFYPEADFTHFTDLLVLLQVDIPCKLESLLHVTENLGPWAACMLLKDELRHKSQQQQHENRGQSPLLHKARMPAEPQNAKQRQIQHDRQQQRLQEVLQEVLQDATLAQSQQNQSQPPHTPNLLPQTQLQQPNPQLSQPQYQQPSTTARPLPLQPQSQSNTLSLSPPLEQMGLDTQLPTEYTPYNTAVPSDEHLSPKVLQLIHLLQAQDFSDFCGIVFVEQRVVASMLARLLRTYPSLRGSLRVDMIVGLRGGGNGGSSLHMSREAQDRVLDDFKRGGINFLVATNVGEEGLDVQACNVVVRFDEMPNSIRSFVQARGRARKRGSRYVIMLPQSRNVASLEATFALLRQADLSVFSVCEHAGGNEEMLRSTRVDDRKSASSAPVAAKPADEDCYIVQATGARLTLSGAVSLLYRYCSILPRDSFTLAVPSFDIERKGDGSARWVAHLPGVALREVSVDASLYPNKAVAKRRLSFEAVKQLHQLGVLDDNLLPIRFTDASSQTAFLNSLEETASNVYNSGTADSIDGMTGDTGTVVGISDAAAVASSHQQPQPPGTAGVCTPSKGKTPLVTAGKQANSVKVPPADFASAFQASAWPLIGAVPGGCPSYRAYAHALRLDGEPFTFCILAPRPLPQFLAFHCVIKLRVFAGSVAAAGTVDLSQEQLEAAQHFQDHVWRVVLPGQCSLINTDWQRLSGKLYFVLPVAKQQNQPQHVAIDWQVISKVCLLETKQSLESECGSQAVELTFDKPSDVVLYTVYNTKNLYLPLGLSDSTLTSPFHEPGKYPTFGAYFAARYPEFASGLDPAQRMISVAHLRCALGKGHAQITERRLCRLAVQNVLLVPALCRIHPLSVSHFGDACRLPAVLTQVERTVATAEFSTSIPALADADMQLMQCALTASTCGDVIDYERLETLGDKVLKLICSLDLFVRYPRDHEGLLSMKRDTIVCNAFLAARASRRQLWRHIQTEPVSGNFWLPPGHFHHVTLHDREIPRKVLADCVESLTAVAFLKRRSIEDASQWLNSMGMPFWPWSSYEIPRLHWSNSSVINSLLPIESIINYKFINPSLLVEALTHPSMNDMVPGYPRLEFVGDAAIDFCVVDYTFHKYPQLPPSSLVDLHQAAVNNLAFAYISVKYGLHRFLRHLSPALHQEIMQYCESWSTKEPTLTFVELQTNEFGGVTASGGDAPKVLADILEALAGAVFVDSGFSYEAVWRSFWPLLREHLESNVTPETVKRDPARDLIELVQKALNSFYNPFVHDFDPSLPPGEQHSCSVVVQGETVCRASAANRHWARKAVAKVALDRLQSGAWVIDKKATEHLQQEQRQKKKKQSRKKKKRSKGAKKQVQHLAFEQHRLQCAETKRVCTQDEARDARPPSPKRQKTTAEPSQPEELPPMVSPQ